MGDPSLEGSLSKGNTMYELISKTTYRNGTFHNKVMIQGPLRDCEVAHNSLLTWDKRFLSIKLPYGTKRSYSIRQIGGNK